MDNNDISVAILTVSDRCFRGIVKDQSGPELQNIVRKQGWKVVACSVVPDSRSDIEAILVDWCDREKIQLILTTGGTGIGPRDVTPEATRKLLDKELPGIAELIRHEGMRHIFTAVLSRAVAGVRNKSLIVNLPGSHAGAEESLSIILKIIPHAMSMLDGGRH